MAEKALVTLRSRPTEAAAAAAAVAVPAARSGCRVEQTTPQGVLMSGEPHQLSALEGQGFRVKLLPETNILQVGNYRINIDLPPPAVPTDLRLPAAESGTWTHHLVQLVAPPTPEWVRELTAVGVTVVESRSGVMGCSWSVSRTSWLGCRPSFRSSLGPGRSSQRTGWLPISRGSRERSAT